MALKWDNGFKPCTPKPGSAPSVASVTGYINQPIPDSVNAAFLSFVRADGATVYRDKTRPVFLYDRAGGNIIADCDEAFLALNFDYTD